MKQKMYDGGEQGRENADTTGDGVLKDLAARNKELLAATEVKGDPRRRGEIVVEGDMDDDLIYLRIDGVLWSEVEYSHSKRMWCIQDCMGECLLHVEHIHAEVPNCGGDVDEDEDNLDATAAVEKAKEMIRDGSLPSPEEAQATYKKNHQ